MTTFIKNTIKLTENIYKILRREWFSVLLITLAYFYHVCPSFNGSANVILFWSFILYVLIVFFWWCHMIVRFIRYGLSKGKKWYKRVISFSIGLTFIIISVYFISCMLYASWTIANISKM